MPRFRAKNGMFAVKRGCQKIFQEKSEICLDMCNGIWYYMQVRNWAHPALLRDIAMNREIAQVSEVTFGEYVRTSGG